uniref:Uncharacterized protein n=1 Tax=Populus alba TaxID=43335 RepID=A0A4U5PZH3_POPAL|nr:hypothetical protein D5086_0000158210 [Populus alba]
MLHSRAEAGQPELIALEKASKQNKTDFGREVPVFRKLYSYSAKDNDQPVPIAIFLVNFDKVRTDLGNKEIDLDNDNCYRVSKSPPGEPVKGKNKTTTKLWLEKFYQKTTNLPEPFPHELAERLEKYLDRLEEQLVDLSSLLYDHRLQEAHLNSSEVLQSALFTHQQVSFDLFNPPLDDYLSLVILLQTVYML